MKFDMITTFLLIRAKQMKVPSLALETTKDPLRREPSPSPVESLESPDDLPARLAPRPSDIGQDSGCKVIDT